MKASTIIKNTGIMYVRQLVLLCLGLFSTRYILDSLGTEDFGIYSLIAGLVGFLSFLSGSMAGATQRFMSYNQKDSSNRSLAEVFNSSMLLVFIIGVILVIGLEIMSYFLFSGRLNISPLRIDAAKFVFHCMVASTFFTVISVPYDACIITHENMVFYAIVGVMESIGKFAISIVLYLTPSFRIELFSLLIVCLTLVCLTAKVIYSRAHYAETAIRLLFVKKRIVQEVSSFTLWTVFSSVCNIIRSNGQDILLNLFYGVTMNAAYGISKQVTGATTGVVGQFFLASRPQIIGHVSRKEDTRALQMAQSVYKISLLLMALFSIPMIVEMPFVLTLWLKNVPENATVFCRFALVSALLLMSTQGFNALIEGVGKIRAYRFATGLCSLAAFPIAYLFLKNGYPPYAIFIGIIISDILLVLVMVHFAVHFTELTWASYFTEIPLKMMPIIAGTAALLFWIPYPEALPPFVRLVCTVATSSTLLVGLSWFALNPQEKAFTGNLVKKVGSRIKW